MIITHVIMSLLLFSPVYFDEFFGNDEKLNLTGEFSLLCGILSFLIFSIIALTSLPSI